ncbi:MAG: hypothetical protein ACI81S_002225, partial [Sphingobacteriales bacterium]
SDCARDKKGMKIKGKRRRFFIMVNLEIQFREKIAEKKFRAKKSLR